MSGELQIGNQTPANSGQKPQPVERKVAAEESIGGTTLPPEQVANVATNGVNDSSSVASASAVEATSAIEVEPEQLKEAVAQLNDYVQQIQRDLHFSYDDSAQVSVVKVVDRGSNEVIRQIPSELALNLARKLNNEEPLRLFNAQV